MTTTLEAPDAPPSKLCRGCDRPLPLDAFARDRSKRDGRQARCRECDAARKRRWREENAEAVRERKRRHYAANADAERERKRRHYESNAEVIRDRVRRYREENVEAERERWRRYAQTPEGRAATSRKEARRRARLAAAEATLTAAEWEAILEERDHRCYVCGAPWDHQEHVIPLASEGAHTSENVRPACEPCNLSKGDASLASWLPRRLADLASYGVTTPEAAARVPALLASNGDPA
jgi:5-methylcytosine-specific restriction endonuclease McrA